MNILCLGNFLEMLKIAMQSPNDKMYVYGSIATIIYLIVLGFIGHFVIKPMIIKYNISILKNIFFIIIPIVILSVIIVLLIDKSILDTDTFYKRMIWTGMTVGPWITLVFITKRD
ncbi:hypothetical protein [Oceanirhabdus sp. W0125-5]|uniref:hypothetical protein n=1 Tax=Oceanirhabdus sp. W0125-5 TaxID=2999116 RepID=UPI0022F33E40|nr:hypothetical protein [Oceanirhabdus sp. W0125-5]WBW97666.1 hypothetical protein OW730_02490 [Oceanirhabdus sp. W0125-5]